VGLILVKELLLVRPAARLRVSDLQLRMLPRLPADTPLYDLLRLFESGRSHMAVVVEPPAGAPPAAAPPPEPGSREAKAAKAAAKREAKAAGKKRKSAIVSIGRGLGRGLGLVPPKQHRAGGGLASPSAGGAPLPSSSLPAAHWLGGAGPGSRSGGGGSSGGSGSGGGAMNGGRPGGWLRRTKPGADGGGDHLSAVPEASPSGRSYSAAAPSPSGRGGAAAATPPPLPPPQHPAYDKPRCIPGQARMRLRKSGSGVFAPAASLPAQLGESPGPPPGGLGAGPATLPAAPAVAPPTASPTVTAAAEALTQQRGFETPADAAGAAAAAAAPQSAFEAAAPEGGEGGAASSEAAGRASPTKQSSRGGGLLSSALSLGTSSSAGGLSAQLSRAASLATVNSWGDVAAPGPETLSAAAAAALTPRTPEQQRQDADDEEMDRWSGLRPRGGGGEGGSAPLDVPRPLTPPRAAAVAATFSGFSGGSLGRGGSVLGRQLSAAASRNAAGAAAAEGAGGGAGGGGLAAAASGMHRSASQGDMLWEEPLDVLSGLYQSSGLPLGARASPAPPSCLPLFCARAALAPVLLQSA